MGSTVTFLPPVGNPPTGPYSSLAPSLPLPPALNSLASPREGESQGRMERAKGGWRESERFAQKWAMNWRAVPRDWQRAPEGSLKYPRVSRAAASGWSCLPGGWGTKWAQSGHGCTKAPLGTLGKLLFGEGCWTVLRAWPFLSCECVCVFMCLWGLPLFLPASPPLHLPILLPSFSFSQTTSTPSKCCLSK